METKETNQEELQKTLLELEMHKRRLEAITQRMQMIEATIFELDDTAKAIDAMKNEKKGNEILVSIGSGSYFKAAVKDKEKILIGAGAGISIEKTTDEAKKTLESRKEGLHKIADELQKNASELSERMSYLSGLYEDLARGMQ